MKNNTVRHALTAMWIAVVLFSAGWMFAQKNGPFTEPVFPPVLPKGQTVVTDTSKDFLKPPETLLPGVQIAETAPTIDFMYYPGQNYMGNPWSAWGDNLAVKRDGKEIHYSSIGDHKWNAFLYEYDESSKTLRMLMDLQKFLKLPEGHYTPAKVHTRLDLGKDGCLYFATHRGSAKYTTDEYHYQGDWIIRYSPETGQGEVVSHGPVGKESIPVSVLDPERMIFYGGTQQGGIFFAYDIGKGKVIYQDNFGPYRYIMFSKTTGRIYYLKKDFDPLRRYDPVTNKSTVLKETLGLRSATQETPQGYIYTVAQKADKDNEFGLFRFDVKTEKIEKVGTAPVGAVSYITSIDADPSGRYLYYCPGSHGNAPTDGSPLVQYDVKTGIKKVIAFLSPFYKEKYGFTPNGTFGTAISPDGDKVYITWHGTRSWKFWDSCALTVVHIPESERKLD